MKPREQSPRYAPMLINVAENNFFYRLVREHTLKLRIFAVLPWALLLFACSSAEVDRTNVKKDPDRALVVGWGTTTGEILQNTVALPLGVRVGGLYVLKVNGQKIENVENIAKLTAGTYDLAIGCHLYVGGSYKHDLSTIHADLKVGRIYELRSRPQGGACWPYLEDVTSAYTHHAP